MNIVRSEALKLLSVRMWLGLAVAAILFTALNAGALVILSGIDLGGTTSPPLTDPATMRAVYGSVGASSLLVLVLGILGITSEYRHQTITATLLATPSRGRMMAGKMTVHALVGAVIGVLCVLTTLLTLLIGIQFKEHAPIDAGTLAAVSGGAILGFAVYAVVGVGFGSLVRNQIAAVTVALVWVMLIEALIVAFLPEVGRWLPGGAINGVLQAPSFGATEYLPVWGSALVLLGYGVLFAGIATRTTLRRDIT